MKYHRVLCVLYAFLAAIFYALNMPLSKYLLRSVSPTFMAAFLYLGAGIGVGILSFFSRRTKRTEELTREDMPYTMGMILLDIAAPVLLMLGLRSAAASSAALLNNFEIVATTLFALLLFHERVSGRLWCGILLITASSALLSVEDTSGFTLSGGALLILAAACCWGLENNCTRQISGKDTFQIVTIKGIFSGLGSLLIALCRGEPFPAVTSMLSAMLLGFVAFGLSIFFYIRAQSGIGAAKTSAYYATAPFVGAALSFLILREPLAKHYFSALFLMAAGSSVVLADTLLLHHRHLHTHTITHTHDGSTHTHTITHSHGHSHLLDEKSRFAHGV